jgi:hypothetical protein
MGTPVWTSQADGAWAARDWRPSLANHLCSSPRGASPPTQSPFCCRLVVRGAVPDDFHRALTRFDPRFADSLWTWRPTGPSPWRAVVRSMRCGAVWPYVKTTEWAHSSQSADSREPRTFEPSYQPHPEPPANRQEPLTGLAAVSEEERLSWSDAAGLLGLSEQGLHDGVNTHGYPAVRPDTERPFSRLDVRDIARLNWASRNRLDPARPPLNVSGSAS